MSSSIPQTVEEEHLEQPNPHWVCRQAFLLVEAGMFTTQAALGLALYHGLYWLAVPLVLLTSHFMHGMLIAFHEASHGMLRSNHRRLNEIDGFILGTFSFMSFSLYRAAHQTHHAFLGTERDEELWPFVHPTQPRWVRRLAAFCELNAGIIFTPLIFMRTFLRKGSPIRAKKVRRRIWTEIVLMAVIWAAIVVTVSALHIWTYFLWVFAVPAFIAGNLQSWRKYIEHVGLTGSTVRSATRSIVAHGPLNRLVSLTLLHEPYHGVHHLQPGLSHPELPHRAHTLAPTHPDEHAPFASYRHALAHLVCELRDPRVGAQWRTTSEQ